MCLNHPSLSDQEVFFDCDNTLVLSEPLAFEVCAKLANEILVQNSSLLLLGKKLGVLTQPSKVYNRN
jgi:beta-phosphoglucomutase-like phosphatase (HAD superfamily)